MRAIAFKQTGGPEVLKIEERPIPEPRDGHIVIKVKAFGLNRAETYFRSGEWPTPVNVTGIECVGEVAADPSDRFAEGQKVAAMMGGMGRTIDGTYAEYVRTPSTNVLPVTSRLSWTDLAAIPESYATAWTCLHRNLKLEPGQVILVRGGTSALGQAAINIASHHGAKVIATTRKQERGDNLRKIGATSVLMEGANLSEAVLKLEPKGIDAVLELVGNSTLLDSMKVLKRGGRVCLAGFLGGGTPIAGFDPLSQMPSGIDFSFFGSFVFGTPNFPLDDVPLQAVVDRAEVGHYNAKPAHVFRFEEIIDAHRALESHQFNGKLVVEV
jgi:NADPH2:quinone reductase